MVGGDPPETSKLVGLVVLAVGEAIEENHDLVMERKRIPHKL